MRLFIALDTNNNVKGHLITVQKQIGNDLAKVNWVSENQMHLTLKFLGEVEENKVELIKNKLKKNKIDEFSLTLDKIGVFPNENYVRVIWVGVSPKEPVIELQEKIEKALEEFNFKKDFEFHPHITLGRVKFVKDKEGFIKRLKEVKVEKKTIEIKDFKLIKSTLTGEGPIYEEMAAF